MPQATRHAVGRETRVFPKASEPNLKTVKRGRLQDNDLRSDPSGLPGGGRTKPRNLGRRLLHVLVPGLGVCSGDGGAGLLAVVGRHAHVPAVLENVFVLLGLICC